MSQQLLEAQRPYKRRQDHGGHHQDRTQVLAGKFVPVIQHRQGKRDQKHKDGGHNADGKRIPQPFHVQTVPEHFQQDILVQPLRQHGVERQKEERPEKDQQHRCAEIRGEFILHHFSHSFRILRY